MGMGDNKKDKEQINPISTLAADDMNKRIKNLEDRVRALEELLMTPVVGDLEDV